MVVTVGAVRALEATPVVSSEPMQRLVTMAQRVARGSAAILITGETGTGKELIARVIHRHSLRCTKPWVDVNCAALPEHLVESELFGYEKGAFSGADSCKPGLFELANTGTLFLDEIGELEPKVQVKLLRVLDGAPYYRLGGSKKVSVDVRIVAATNQPLEQAVKAGRFRSDLYHRLGQIQLKVPPLRERPGDVVALAEHFLEQCKPGARWSAEALSVLQGYSWPGNVRELRNVVIHAAAIADSDTVVPGDLPEEFGGDGVPAAPAESDEKALEDIEREAILQALNKTNHHQGMAAAKLGIARRTLSRKLKQYRIEEEARGNGDGEGINDEPLGVLNAHEQQYYRAVVDVPVQISCGGTTSTVNMINISGGGMQVEGVNSPFEFSGPLQLTFSLPGMAHPLNVGGQIVWADVEGKAGIRFTSPGAAANELRSWLRDKQAEEGWRVGENGG